MDIAPDAAPEQAIFLTVGEALIDIVTPSDGSAPGEYVGGSPTNVATGLAALGHASRLATWFGADARGEQIATHLAEHGVHLSTGSAHADRTSTATAQVDESGVARYAFDLTWRLPQIELTGVGHLHSGSLAATIEPGGTAWST